MYIFEMTVTVKYTVEVEIFVEDLISFFSLAVHVHV